MVTSPLLIVRTQQLEALRPALERQFIERLADWLAPGADAQGAPLTRAALEARVAAGVDRARGHGFKLKRDVARFVALDFQWGPNFEDQPGNAWMRDMLAQQGLSPATRLYRMECRVARLAAVAAERAAEDKADA